MYGDVNIAMTIVMIRTVVAIVKVITSRRIIEPMLYIVKAIILMITYKYA